MWFLATVKLQGSDTDHQPPSSAENKEWNYTSTPPILPPKCFHGMVRNSFVLWCSKAVNSGTMVLGEGKVVKTFLYIKGVDGE